jgi:uncharacterized protein YndB with AHSA1/START domain
MRFEVVVTRHYPHPVDSVWAGLTTADAISQWLMQTEGFVAEVGCQFQMSCANEDGRIDVYRCEVLELDPPTRMRWSWLLSGNEADPTEVEFRLEPKDNGTELTVLHRGDRDRDMLERFKAGWPSKLDQLAETIAR